MNPIKQDKILKGDRRSTLKGANGRSRLQDLARPILAKSELEVGRSRFQARKRSDQQRENISFKTPTTFRLRDLRAGFETPFLWKAISNNSEEILES